MNCCWQFVEHLQPAHHHHHHQSKCMLLHYICQYFHFLLLLRSTIVGGSTMLVHCHPQNVFSSRYCWVLRASHLLISDGLHMSFFSPLTHQSKLETKQEQTMSHDWHFKFQQSSNVKISQATVLHNKHLLAPAQIFFLMDAKGVQQVGLGQQG